MNAAPTPPKSLVVLVPVYRDLAVTRRCLNSLLNSKLPSNTTIVVIDDCSPETELSTYCRKLASDAPVSLIVNEQNLGFVRSANKGFLLDPEADVLLLNSDTVVSGDWLQRMRLCAYTEPEIGTVTPFSNNGTICSYPVFPIENPLPYQWTEAELDIAFKTANRSLCAEIPTAVGFCMYIKRSCLDATGLFDEINFGQGYGEECDFSLRATLKGWKHVIAADVFVFHEGGASFASESKHRKRHADEVMNKLHPHYHRLVSEFLRSDPLAVFRKNVDAYRMAAKPSRNTDILNEHQHYTRLLLDKIEASENEIKSEQAQRMLLGALLDDCRKQFSDTDRALLEARQVIDELKGHLDNARLYANQLHDHIQKIEHSRSWRYTAWLRRTS